MVLSPAAATAYYGRGVSGNIETTALAVYSLGLVGREAALVQGGLGYIATNRDYRGTWHSTQGTILALRALLAGTAADADQQVSVRINGQDGGPQTARRRPRQQRGRHLPQGAIRLAHVGLVCLEEGWAIGQPPAAARALDSASFALFATHWNASARPRRGASFRRRPSSRRARNRR